MKKPIVIAVSGVKNSGKTTLITRVIPRLREKDLKVAVIKHDGHDFDGDVPDTDSYRHKAAGAYGTAVFSGRRYLILKEQLHVSAEDLILNFPEADLILLEGMKGSEYPKIEVMREANRERFVCECSTVLAYAADFKIEECEKPVFDLGETDEIAHFIFEFYEGRISGKGGT